MEHQGADMTRNQGQAEHVAAAPTPTGVSRRQILAGGGLALGAMFLHGCGGAKQAALPGPYWGPDEAVTNTIGAYPAQAPSAPPVARPTQTVTLPNYDVPQGVVPRSAWTRAGVARKGEIFDMGAVRRITVHHDGMPLASLRTTGDIAARIEQIRTSHVYGRGWADIGYHYVIDPTGRVWAGRSTQYQGAHVKDQNENNLGVLVLGNFDLQQPTPAARQALDRFIVNQMQRYNIPMASVRTHRERAPTECPGTYLQSYMLRTRDSGGVMYAMAARAGLARG
jgi:hypothetical protein